MCRVCGVCVCVCVCVWGGWGGMCVCVDRLVKINYQSILTQHVRNASHHKGCKNATYTECVLCKYMKCLLILG